MKIIEQIEQQRKLKGMNKSTLCLFANINANSYSNYLNGKSSPTVRVLEKLLKALECSIIIIDNELLKV